MSSEDEERRAWFRREVVPLEPALRAYAQRFCRGGPDEVEDLVHDVFAKLMVYDGWRGVTNVGAFATRSLKNIALDTVRRRKIVSFELSADLDRYGFTDEAPIADRVLEGQDELKALARLIGELPPQCRKVFTLRKVYGLSHAEIAARLGLSVSTVEKHVMRGLRFCSEHLAREPRPWVCSQSGTDMDARARREKLRNEAAQWVVRLADPSCTDLDRAGFEAWRAESIDHEVIFERELAAWARLDRASLLRPPGRAVDPDLLAPHEPISVPGRSQQRWRALAASALVALGVGAVAMSGVFAAPAYATGLGERRVVVLSDGSRVELNTNSKIVVRYTRGVREVELLRGEAMFEVASNERPFVVKTKPARLEAKESVVAVRLEGAGAAVTVKSGVVEAQGQDDQAAPVAALASGTGAVVARNGISVHPVSAAEIDRSLVWRNGAIALSGETLEKATAEFNRYNSQKILVDDTATAALRVGGYFQTSDVSGFVRAVTQTFPVKATRAPDGRCGCRTPAELL